MDKKAKCDLDHCESKAKYTLERPSAGIQGFNYVCSKKCGKIIYNEDFENNITEGLN